MRRLYRGGIHKRYTKSPMLIVLVIGLIGAACAVHSAVASPVTIGTSSLSDASDHLVVEYRHADSDAINTNGVQPRIGEPFRLYGDGLAVCTKPGDPTAAKQYDITSRQLGREDMIKLVQQIIDTGFLELKPEYYHIPVAEQQEVIRVVLQDQEHFTAYYNDVAKPEAYAKTEAIIKNFCDHTTEAYIPQQATLQIAVVDKPADKEQVQNGWIPGQAPPSDKTTAPFISDKVAGDQARALAKQFTSDTVQTYKYGNRIYEVTLDVAPPEAKNEQQQIDYQKIRQKKDGNVISRLLSPKVEAADSQRQVRAVIVVPKDYAVPNFSAAYNTRIAQVRDWYCKQLGKCYTLQSGTLTVVTSPLTLDQLKTCPAYIASGCIDINTHQYSTILAIYYNLANTNTADSTPGFKVDNTATQAILGFPANDPNFVGNATIGDTDSGRKWAFGLSDPFSSNSDSSAGAYLNETIAHEFGHNLGLYHTLDSDLTSVMHSYGGCTIPTLDTGHKDPSLTDLVCSLQPSQAAFVATSSPYFSSNRAALFMNQSVNPGEQLVSDGGRYALQVMSDGSVAILDNATATTPWQSKRTFISSTLVFKANGDLTLRSPTGKTVWHTKTSKTVIDVDPSKSVFPGRRAVLQTDGKLVVYDQNNKVVWSSATSHGTIVPSSTTKTRVLTNAPDPNDYDELLVSNSERYSLDLSADGNLFVRDDTTNSATWNNGKSGYPGSYVIMQPDGNLVEYNSANQAIWNSGSFVPGGNDPGMYMSMQDDGNLVVLSGTNQPLWSIMTGLIVTPVASLTPNQYLIGGQYLTSPNGQYRFTLQVTGNLVVFRNSDNYPLWYNNQYTSDLHKTTGYVIMQPDGNLVQFDASHQVVWQSGTSNLGGTRITLQDDGNVVMFNAANQPVWSTNTGIIYPTTLSTNQTLQSGQLLQSANKRYILEIGGDGNLFAWDAQVGYIWMNHKAGNSGSRVVMQPDGNLVEYNTGGAAVWQSDTFNTGTNNRITLQDDGNLVMFNAGGTIVWSTNTDTIIPASLATNQTTTLYVNQSLTAANGYRLTVQPDGNLVLYNRSNAPIWYVGYGSGSNNRLVMQPDGNLVYYTASGGVVWYSNTYGSGANRVTMQLDGNLVIYRDSLNPDGTHTRTALWQLGTAGR